MSAHADRPLNWNVLAVSASDGRRASSTRCCRRPGPARSGGRVVALTMPIFAENNMSLGTFCALWLIPGWRDILSLPMDEKIGQAAVTRRSGPTCRPRPVGIALRRRWAEFGHYRIGDTVNPANKVLEGRGWPTSPRSGGPTRGTPWSTSASADGYAGPCSGPSPWPTPTRTGRSAGTCGSNPTSWSAGPTPGPTSTACWARRTPPGSWRTACGAAELETAERAVQLMTDVPARLFGLDDRGRLVAGA